MHLTPCAMDHLRATVDGSTVIVEAWGIVEEMLPAVEELGANLIVMGSNPDRAFG
jgi:nucleotide-binding universal stress UspA family protein